MNVKVRNLIAWLTATPGRAVATAAVLVAASAAMLGLATRGGVGAPGWLILSALIFVDGLMWARNAMMTLRVREAAAAGWRTLASLEGQPVPGESVKVGEVELSYHPAEGELAEMPPELQEILRDPDEPWVRARLCAAGAALFAVVTGACVAQSFALGWTTWWGPATVPAGLMCLVWARWGLKFAVWTGARQERRDFFAERSRSGAAPYVGEDVDALLESVRGTLTLCDPAGERLGIHAPEDGTVEALCEATGYGAVMDAASRRWRLKDGSGAFTVGPPVSLVHGAVDTLDRARELLRAMEPEVVAAMRIENRRLRSSRTDLWTLSRVCRGELGGFTVETPEGIEVGRALLSLRADLLRARHAAGQYVMVREEMEREGGVEVGRYERALNGLRAVAEVHGLPGDYCGGVDPSAEDILRVGEDGGVVLPMDVLRLLDIAPGLHAYLVPVFWRSGQEDLGKGEPACAFLLLGRQGYADVLRSPDFSIQVRSSTPGA